MNTERISKYFEKQGGKATLGIDGFVDEVWQIIAVRKSETEYELHNSMKKFAKSIYDSGVGGYTSEIIRKRRRFGGFTANTGNAINHLGFDLTMVGAFGKDSIDPAFSSFQQSNKLYSVREPGICEIFEFSDGKLMLPYSGEVSSINWESVTKAVPFPALEKAYSEANIVGFGYWLLLRNFDELLTKLYENFLKDGKCTRIFFDFADIRRDSKQRLFNTLNIIAELNKQLPATLSLNEHEAMQLFSYMDKKFSLSDPQIAHANIAHVREQVGLDELVVHTPHFASASSVSEGVATVLQRYCEKPVITSGAGDNFNGGYIAASVRNGELTLKERLAVGNAVAGFYVKNGYPPDRTGLLNELKGVLKNQ